ncbi:nucleolar complex protein 3 homolog [Drosophila sulfurigaster albostrigata]|uniref:nucleolar complex protein 3 homolog n=1 Tax=Drosophila sulfurigaster albostrigata TaxID=89887 RepID=UPI002D219C40|nr:nucleolar complex protein 3 homolog [Drosophila sulfurigaster albostrigata]
MGTKKVKISSVKRAAHLKSKKTPLSKQQQQKIKQKREQLNTKREKGQNIFSQKAHKRDNLAQRKKYNKQASLGFVPGLNEDEDDDEGGDLLLDNVADMLDGDDLALLQENKRKRKAKPTEDQQLSVGLEKAYATATKKEQAAQKIKVNLLPIKSRDGEIITRTTEVDYIPKPKRKAVDEEDEAEGEDEEDEDDEEVYEDSDDDVVNDAAPMPKQKLISTTDLLIARQQEIERQKYRIGIICSGLLEKPEDKMRNFNALYELMDEKNRATGMVNLLAVRKLAIVSVTEIFKDILPEYRVGQVDTKMQTVRKATLDRVTFENALLQQFKKFLQKLEQLTAQVNKRGGHKTPQSVKMATVAVECMCELLLAHPYFNYVQNIAQLLVYMLNCNYGAMRQAVNQCFRTLFSNDKRLDMTLFVVRRINHLIKTKQNNVHLECITCMMGLKIKHVNLDAEKENELKQKKLESHRQRLLSLSKKERKRRKKLTEVNRELDETRAEENKQTKHHKLTEIIKMVFTIYFRVLKNDPTSRVLSAILEGLAEFAHVINLEFFADLIDVLNRILEEQDLGYREQLHCIQTIFVILSGQGEVLNIDPIRFYQHFYRNMLVVQAGKNHDDFAIILRTLDEVLVKRRRNMSQQRLMAFVKRLLTGSLHLLHNGTLATLGTIKQTFQLTSVLDALLDTDTTIGSGRYDPELDDPEYCNAASTALYELTLLGRHYHPTVRRMAAHIANGVPASGEGALPTDIGKLNAHELFAQYDSTQMAFNPTIPLPKQGEPKLKKGKHLFIRSDFKQDYGKLLKDAKTTRISTKNALQFDFLSELNKLSK